MEKCKACFTLNLLQYTEQKTWTDVENITVCVCMHACVWEDKRQVQNTCTKIVLWENQLVFVVVVVVFSVHKGWKDQNLSFKKKKIGSWNDM